MQNDASGNCVVDPLGSTGTVSTATKYTTLTDTGSSTDPCGYYVYLRYTTTGSNTHGAFRVLSDNTILMKAGIMVFSYVAFSLF